jgi:hypothetical protein
VIAEGAASAAGAARRVVMGERFSSGGRSDARLGEAVRPERHGACVNGATKLCRRFSLKVYPLRVNVRLYAVLPLAVRGAHDSNSWRRGALVEILNDDQIKGLPGEPSNDDANAKAWHRKIHWTQLRVWVYQERQLRELPSLHAFSALGAWKSGRSSLGASFVAGTKLVKDPRRVDWTDFPDNEAREGERDALLPRAPECKPGPPPRDARKLQLAALRKVARVPEGISRADIHARTAGALLNRGLIEIAVIETKAVFRCTSTGRSVLLRADARRALRGSARSKHPADAGLDRC